MWVDGAQHASEEHGDGLDPEGRELCNQHERTKGLDSPFHAMDGKTQIGVHRKRRIRAEHQE